MRAIVLAGPTCVGKTSTAIVVARSLGAEIVNADSMQVYRGMDIGTEKPTPEQRAMVPHHMVDVASAEEHYSAGRFVDDLAPVIERLRAEGKPVLITGGTGLYIKALTRGIFEGPGADMALRERLMSEGDLYARLSALDPEAASAIHPSDTRRIVRALEICMSGGGRASEIRAEHTRPPFQMEFAKVVLTRDRAELYAMIDARVDGMFARGLVNEVRALLDSAPGMTALQAIGYKEVAAYLRGEHPLVEAVRLVKRNTRRLAKRQLTWFRGESGFKWVDITGVGDPEEAARRVMAAL